VSYRIKRVDPFWLKTPIVPALAVAAGAVALFGAQSGRAPVAAAAAIACGIAVFLATKPALSGVFAVFGLLGGIVTFLAGPSAGLSPAMRALATAGFSLFYMVLMDVVVLAVSAIYNMFTRAGFGGLSLELEKPM
jgi:hypothetical protein